MKTAFRTPAPTAAAVVKVVPGEDAGRFLRRLRAVPAGATPIVRRPADGKYYRIVDVEVDARRRRVTLALDLSRPYDA